MIKNLENSLRRKLLSLLKTEIQRVYLTTDDKMFLDVEDALQHEESLEKKRAIIKKKEETVNKINELFLKVLNNNNWGLYFKGEPMQSIPMSDGGKVYKVNEVKVEQVYEEIQKEIESDWQKQNEQTNNKSLNG
jgi:hypothetical protein